jgi:hypothetical protein
MLCLSHVRPTKGSLTLGVVAVAVAVMVVVVVVVYFTWIDFLE